MLLKRNLIFILPILISLIVPRLNGQNQKIADSLAIIYANGVANDSAKLEMLRKLSFNEVKDLNLAQKYAEEQIQLSKKTGNKEFLRSGYFQLGNKKRLFGDLEQALDAYIKSAEVARLDHNTKGEGNAYGAIADIYSMSNNHPNARLYYKKAIRMLRKSNDSIALASAILNAGEEYRLSEIYDTAYAYFEESRIIFEQKKYLIGKAYSTGNLGMVNASTGEIVLAEKNLKEAIAILEQLGDYYPICAYLISMADIYMEKGDENAAINYAQKSLEIAHKNGLKEQIRDANLKLAEFSDQYGKPAEAYKFYKNYIVYRDSINNIKTVQSMANLRTDFEVSQKQREVDRLNQQKQNQLWWIITIAGMLFTAFVLLFMFYRNNKIKIRANRLLHIQKAEIEMQKKNVEATLSELKATQAQLIQSEKMASLGELTAGIAHEIQNPLNFVNNFSDLNKELLLELKEEIQNSNQDEAISIADDVIRNEEKINDHGKRAESIVKGMLMHSRGSSGKKEPTNINALADEYLRLSYHGLRAKDKSFNADFMMDPDETLPKINVIPQNIGRVLLNLINNAFYSVSERAKNTEKDYQPMVKISTKRVNKTIEIKVIDNGTGIPDTVKEKIFQPFFTTKPAGQGTGLGLSLSYDIVKAHGGDLTVETNGGTTFTITLPVL